MVTYQLEWRTPQRSGWEPYGPPADSVAVCTNAAAHSTRVGGEEFRVVGLSTEAQPDGTIVRRELSPDELAAAIRGEQEPPKQGKEVVLKWRLFEDMLSAESIIFDHSDSDDSPLLYSIFCYGDGDEWKADFDGRDIASGPLEHCMAACHKIEADAIIQQERR